MQTWTKQFTIQKKEGPKLSYKTKLKDLDLVPDIFGTTFHQDIYKALLSKFKITDIYLSFPPYPVLDAATITINLENNMSVMLTVSFTYMTDAVKPVDYEKIKAILKFLSKLEIFPEFKFTAPSELRIRKVDFKNLLPPPGVEVQVDSQFTLFLLPERAKPLTEIAILLLDTLKLNWLEAWFIYKEGLGFVAKVKKDTFLEVEVRPWKR